MPGHPGTPRIGVPLDEHIQKTQPDGVSLLDTPVDGPFRETHFLYNPGEQARATPQDPPGKYYQRIKQQYEAASNHDAFGAGDLHVLQMDERKVLNNYIYNVDVVCAEDEQVNYGTPETTA